MNIAKNMEAIFVAATFAICAISYNPSEAIASDISSPQVAAQSQTDGEVQTVVVVAKRV